jgi:AcrR family transcriptional regulator
VGTRDVILDAAALVMRTRGFARATTKEIARASGYSEATLYKHFQDKTDLFLAVMRERLPSLGPVLGGLEAKAGRGELRGRLVAAARGAITFYTASFPMSASIFSEPDLLSAHRTAVTLRGSGPHKPVEAMARYLRAEQEQGRIRPEADCDAAAGLFLGACFQYAFLICFDQRDADPATAEADAYAASITDTLLAGLASAGSS